MWNEVDNTLEGLADKEWTAAIIVGTKDTSIEIVQKEEQYASTATSQGICQGIAQNQDHRDNFKRRH